MSAGPPRPHLAFRVGVIGHRPNRLQEADLTVLRERLAVVLDSVRAAVERSAADPDSLYVSGPPRLTAISLLAQGIDRLFAEEALRAGYGLSCPMPFPRPDYEKDFADGRDRFHELLDRARHETSLVVFELDGDRANAGRAYTAAGRVVVNQSDLLIIVWDGKASRGAGGTVEMLRTAAEYRLPIVWIDAVAPHGWQLGVLPADLPMDDNQPRSVPRSDTAWPLDQVVAEVVRSSLAVPSRPRAAGGPTEEALARAFFGERKPRYTLGVVWKPFRDLLGGVLPAVPRFRVPDFVESIAGAWPLSQRVASWSNARLREAFAWADKLSEYYGDLYRTSFLAAYLFGAFAVAFALLPLVPLLAVLPLVPPLDESALWPSAVELVLIGVATALVWLGNRRRWHERWMDYRLLAELVRQLRALVPLGGGRPSPRLPPHLRAYGDPTETWMHWYVRALERAMGLPSDCMDAGYLAECREYLAGVLRGQLDFHRRNEHRSELIERRLHVIGFSLFILTIVTCILHFFVHPVGHVLIFAAAVLPALGGAAAAIANQAEFRRLARRSAAMAERLEQHLAQLDSSALPTVALVDQAVRAAQLMVDEVSDWRVVFQDRPLVTPT